MFRGLVRYRGWIVLGAICALALAVVLFANSFQQCLEANDKAHAQQALKDSLRVFIGIRWWCLGIFVDQNGIAVTALATVAVAWFTFSLRQATNKLWQAGREALETTERAYIVIRNFDQELTTRLDQLKPVLQGQRPVYASGEDLGLHVTRYAVQPLWENVGNTPTRLMTIQVDWGPPDRVGTYKNDPQPFFVAPKATEPSEMHEIMGLNALIQNGMAGTLGPVPLLLIWGRAEYGDVFGNAHWLIWCYRLRPERHRGDELEVHFIQWGDYNGSD